MSKSQLEKFDENMKTLKSAEDGLLWREAHDPQFHLAGFKWFGQDKLYWRLPANPELELPPGPEYLKKNTAGGQVRFQTNSRKIAVRGKLMHASEMHHMPPTGQSGFDLYFGAPGKQRFFNNTKFTPKDTEFEQELLARENKEMWNFTINFPLYNGVEKLEIGLDPDSEILPPPPYAIGKPVIVYGTSITQGGCACRPGMAYTNILSRRLNLEFVNLGFSGSGKGEPEMARTIAEMPCEPCLYILDYEANCVSPELFRKTLPEFIDILREKYPEVPILIVSCFHMPRELVVAEHERFQKERLQIQREIVERKISEGDKNISFFDGRDMLGKDYDECTVDGVHPTDLGFYLMAEALEDPVKDILFKK